MSEAALTLQAEPLGHQAGSALGITALERYVIETIRPTEIPLLTLNLQIVSLKHLQINRSA